MSERLNSISAVLIIDSKLTSEFDLSLLEAELVGIASESEIILIANGVDSNTTRVIQNLVRRTADAICIFLSDRLDWDTARLVGIDHAVCDYVLLTSGTKAECCLLSHLSSQALAGYDLIFAESEVSQSNSPWLYDFLARGFFKGYRWVTGLDISRGSPELALLSRDAAVSLSRRPGGEILLRTRSLGQGFSAKQISDLLPCLVEDGLKNDSEKNWIREGLKRASRALIASSTAPIRLVEYISLLTAALAGVYSLYVIGIYLGREDVEPGWVTISLQISGMMILFSLMFSLIAEYIVQLHASIPLKRYYSIVRELRNPQRRRMRHLNIVDNKGEPKVGAPDGWGDVGDVLAPTPEKWNTEKNESTRS